MNIIIIIKSLKFSDINKKDPQKWLKNFGKWIGQYQKTYSIPIYLRKNIQI